MSDISEVLSGAECGDHPLGLEDGITDGAETIVAMGSCSCYGPTIDYKTCGSWCDSGSFGMAKLKDGRFLVVRESSDSTGHGCQCDGSASVHKTFKHAWTMGFGAEERDAAKPHLPKKYQRAASHPEPDTTRGESE